MVIPLPRLGDYSDGIERINIELSIQNKLRLLDTLTEYFHGRSPVDKLDTNLPSEELIGDRRASALSQLAITRDRWQWLLEHLDRPFHEYRERWPHAPLEDAAATPASVFHALRDMVVRVSWKREMQAELEQLFSGNTDGPILAAIRAIQQSAAQPRVCRAAHACRRRQRPHQPAGQLRRLRDAAKRAQGGGAHHGAGALLGRSDFRRARHRHHQAGIPQREEIAPFRAYKQQVDPNGHFNRGKLLPGADLAMAYTPSFSLLGAESLILEQSDIGAISDSIKDCLRCGKCKPVCSTHVPRANLLYSPRNKILGVGLLTEAFLYEEQTRRGVSLKHFEELSDVADHCTVCHRCVKPCPVKIDFGDVSVAMRNFLRKTGNKSFNPGTAVGMAFLTAKDPATIKALRTGLVGVAYKAQRLGNAVGKRLGLIGSQTRQPPATVGKGRSRSR